MDGIGRGVLFSAIAGAAMGVSYFGLRLITGSAKEAELEERLERAESAARTRSPEPAIIPAERLAALASPVATEPEPSPVAELSELVDTAPVGAKVTCVVEVDGKVVGKWQGEPEQLKFEKLNSAPSSPRGGNHAEFDEAHTSVSASVPNTPRLEAPSSTSLRMSTPRTSRRREQLQQLFSLLVTATNAEDSKLGIEGIELLSTAAGSIPEMQLRARTMFDRLKRNDMADQLTSNEFVMLFDCHIPDSVTALDSIIQRIRASQHAPVVPSTRAASAGSQIPRISVPISSSASEIKSQRITAEEDQDVEEVHELREKRERRSSRPSLVPRLNLSSVNAPDEVESNVTAAPAKTSPDRVAKLKQVFSELDENGEGFVQLNQVFAMKGLARSRKLQEAKKAIDSLLKLSNATFESDTIQLKDLGHLSDELGAMEDTQFENLIQQFTELTKECRN